MSASCCARCGLSDGPLLDLDTGSVCHPEPRDCIALLRARLAPPQAEGAERAAFPETAGDALARPLEAMASDPTCPACGSPDEDDRALYRRAAALLRVSPEVVGYRWRPQGTDWKWVVGDVPPDPPVHHRGPETFGGPLVKVPLEVQPLGVILGRETEAATALSGEGVRSGDAAALRRQVAGIRLEASPGPLYAAGWAACLAVVLGVMEAAADRPADPDTPHPDSAPTPPRSPGECDCDGGVPWCENEPNVCARCGVDVTPDSAPSHDLPEGG